MKSSISLKWVHLALSLVAAAIWVPALSAGPVKADLGDVAVGDVEAGNVDSAAQKLGNDNLAKKGTLAWYHQSSVALLGRAEELGASGDIKGSRRAAAAAIRIMEQGIKKEADTARSPDLAQILVQLAATYDHVFGDRSTATRYYSMALQEMPDLAEAKDALANYAAEADRVRKFVKGGN